jgi:FKBP12-rapamycin complex-associated protein
MSMFCDKYDLLPLQNKVEIFRHVLDNARGDDIQKVSIFVFVMIRYCG